MLQELHDEDKDITVRSIQDTERMKSYEKLMDFTYTRDNFQIDSWSILNEIRIVNTRVQKIVSCEKHETLGPCQSWTFKIARHGPCFVSFQLNFKFHWDVAWCICFFSNGSVFHSLLHCIRYMVRLYVYIYIQYINLLFMIHLSCICHALYSELIWKTLQNILE